MVVQHGQQPQKEISWKVKNSLYCITYDQLFNYIYTIARKLSKYIIFSDSYDKQKGDGYANRLAISLLFRKFGNMDESIREVFQYFALSLGFPPAIKILHTFLDCSTVQVCYKLLYNHV